MSQLDFEDFFEGGSSGVANINFLHREIVKQVLVDSDIIFLFFKDNTPVAKRLFSLFEMMRLCLLYFSLFGSIQVHLTLVLFKFI